MATPVANTHGSTYKSFLAGGTIAANRVVVLDTTVSQVVAGSAIAGKSIGVNQFAVVSGEQATVQLFGVAKCVASASITLGDEVMVTASGSGKVSTSSGATAQSIGVALTAAGADGDVIEVLLALPAVKRAPNS